MTTRNGSQRGMSLIEVLVATAILALAVIIALVVYDASRKAFKKGENATEQQEAVRIAYDRLTADLRMLGYNVNPDGNPNRPDEQLEGALDHAIVFRGDFDINDAAASTPETALATGAFPTVSTGNDEIVAYVLSKPDGTGPDSITFQADVSEAARDGDVENVTINNVVLNPTTPPYTLYRITLNNDNATYGSAGFVVRTPIVENVRDLAFTYYNPTGTFKDASSTIAETSTAKTTRGTLTHIGVSLIGMTRDQDINFNDTADPSSRRYRKFELKGDITPRNMRMKGMQDLNSDVIPPNTPATPSLVTGHCGGLLATWTPNALAEGVTQYRVNYGTSPGSSAGASLTSGSPYFLSGLTTGTTYYVSIQALDASGNVSPKSGEVSATVANTNTPSAPTGVSASNDQNYYVRVNWSPTTTNTANVPAGDPAAPSIRDLAGYRIYRSTSSGFTPNTATNLLVGESVLKANAIPPHYDTPVIACQNYYYRMSAVDTCGVESAFAAETGGIATNPGILPEAPVGVTANFITGGAARIDWNRVTKDVSGKDVAIALYKVYRSAPIDLASGPGSAVWIPTPIAQTSGLTYTDSSMPALGAGQVVYYRVTAEDLCPNVSAPSVAAAAQCAFSGDISFVAPTDGQLVAGVVPVTVVVTGGTDTYTGITITYTHSVGGLRRTFNSTTAGVSWIDTGWLASPAGSYTITATVVNSNGCAKSKTITVTAASTVGCCLALYPDTVTPLTCAGGSTGCAEVSYKMGNNTCLTAVRVDAMTVNWTDISGNRGVWQTARFNGTNIAAVGSWTTTLSTTNPATGTATKSNFSPGPQVPYANPMSAANVTTVTYVFDKKAKQGQNRNIYTVNDYTFTLLDSAGTPSDIQTTCHFPNLTIE
jgi:prepilin-type N-terminal cleavage/methylation domain-containing protein